jgi:hypothetical protein
MWQPLLELSYRRFFCFSLPHKRKDIHSWMESLLFVIGMRTPKTKYFPESQNRSRTSTRVLFPRSCWCHSTRWFDRFNRSHKTKQQEKQQTRIKNKTNSNTTICLSEQEALWLGEQYLRLALPPVDEGEDRGDDKSQCRRQLVMTHSCPSSRHRLSSNTIRWWQRKRLYQTK